jgi:hypothetical protein
MPNPDHADISYFGTTHRILTLSKPLRAYRMSYNAMDLSLLLHVFGVSGKYQGRISSLVLCVKKYRDVRNVRQRE